MRSSTSALLALILLGCADLTSEKPTAVEQPVEADPAPAQPPAVEEKSDTPVHFKLRVAELVDLKQAMAENDKLVEVRNRINTGSYVTAVAQGYFAAASNIQLIQLKHTVDIMHASEGKYPSLEEFKKLLSESGVKLGNLYEYQMYAYDDTTGEITILEDRAHKKRIYEAAGREYPHAE